VGGIHRAILAQDQLFGPDTMREEQAMSRWSGIREQRDAVNTKATPATVPAEPYPPAVSRGHHSTGQLRHVHVVINGHEVEVTEDDIGVTELHLE
jgi:hypothetical protein